MTRERDIERVLDEWFATGPNQVSDRVLDIVADRIERQPQRTAWRMVWKEPRVRRFSIVGLAAALIAVAIVGLSLAGTSRPVRPSPAPVVTPSTSASPSPRARQSAAASPSLAIGPGLVAYVHWTPGLNFRLEYLLPDGRGQELLPDIPGTQETPAWSADGIHLAFAARDPRIADSQEQIWQTDAAGAPPRLITSDCHPPDCLNELAPAYSADGGRIAFIRFAGPLGGPPISSVVAIRDLATGTVTELASTRVAFKDAILDRPSWSPDGTRLVFSEIHHNATLGSTDGSVIVVDVNGRNLRPLTQPGFKAGDAQWSPDGSRIVFAREPIRFWSGAGQGAGANQWIYTIAPDGTGLTQLTSAASGGRSGGPSWTAGGTQILYDLIGATNTPSGDHAAPSLFVMNADGSNPTTVAHFSDCCRWYPVQQPMP